MNQAKKLGLDRAGNAKGGSITVPLTSCLNGLDKSVLQIRTKIVSCHTADSKPVKQEDNSRVILPPLVFPGQSKGSETKKNGGRRSQARRPWFVIPSGL
jgi:hypothetical protein